MSDFAKKGSIVFGLIMFAIGVAWVVKPMAANWGALSVVWFGVGALAFSLSKFSK